MILDNYAIRINDQAQRTIGHVRRYKNTWQRTENNIGQVYHNLVIYYLLSHCDNFNHHEAAEGGNNDIRTMLPEKISFIDCIAIEPSSRAYKDSRFGFQVQFSFHLYNNNDIDRIHTFLNSFDITTYEIDYNN